MYNLSSDPFLLRTDGNSVTAKMVDSPENGQLAEAVRKIADYSFGQEGVGYLIFRKTDETEEDSWHQLVGHLCHELGLSEDALNQQGVCDTLVLNPQDGEVLVAVRPVIRLHPQSYMVIATLLTPEDGSKPTRYGILAVVKETCETVFSEKEEEKKIHFITFRVENDEPWRDDLVSLFHEQFGVAPNAAKDGPPRSATLYRYVWEKWLRTRP